MALDSYSPCPCGSGKKFKFCCEPIYPGINRAFEQEAAGQHDTALRLMNELVAQHPTNPEAWVQKAQLLLQQGKLEEGEAALEEAFKRNPQFPHALLLRSLLRMREGELGGALVLARKAADAYSPEALDPLSDAYRVIFDCEMRLNRPVAGRVALQQRLRCVPADEEARQEFDALFGADGRFPACVRREYRLRPPGTGVTGLRRSAWDRVLASTQTPRLSEVARIFGQLTHEDPKDAAAWFNLALGRAWLGDNRAALDALEQYLPLEDDDARGEEASALAEVLRCGAGLEDLNDHINYSFAFQTADLSPVSRLLEEWSRTGRLVLPTPERQDVFIGLLLEGKSTELVMASASPELAPLMAYVTIQQGVVQFMGPREEAVLRVREELARKLSPNLAQMPLRRSPLPFHDMMTEGLVFPTGRPDALTAERARAASRRFLEVTWPSRPLRALRGLTPREAAPQPTGRKRVLGVLRFLEDCCATGGMFRDYLFDEVRRSLGLLGAEAPGSESLPAPPIDQSAAAPPKDLSVLDAAGLAGLVDGDLTDEQLEQAYQAAQRLSDTDLAVRFARALVGRPANPGRPDRYPWYQFLITQALAAGDVDAALNYLSDGERVDGEVNEGRRRNDYDLRRGQVHARRGEADAAADTFQRLIDRVPDEMKFRGTAAETLLRLKQPERALRFAEEGLVQARKQNDRDTEQYLQELVAAARKQMA